MSLDVAFGVVFVGLAVAAAACAAALLLPWFKEGRIETRWKRVVLFASAEIVFFYALLKALPLDGP